MLSPARQLQITFPKGESAPGVRRQPTRSLPVWTQVPRLRDSGRMNVRAPIPSQKPCHAVGTFAAHPVATQSVLSSANRKVVRHTRLTTRALRKMPLRLTIGGSARVSRLPTAPFCSRCYSTENSLRDASVCVSTYVCMWTGMQNRAESPSTHHV